MQMVNDKALAVETSLKNTNTYRVLVINHWLSVDNFNYATWCLHDSQKRNEKCVSYIWYDTQFIGYWVGLFSPSLISKAMYKSFRRIKWMT